MTLGLRVANGRVAVVADEARVGAVREQHLDNRPSWLAMASTLDPSKALCKLTRAPAVPKASTTALWQSLAATMIGDSPWAETTLLGKS